MQTPIRFSQTPIRNILWTAWLLILLSSCAPAQTAAPQFTADTLENTDPLVSTSELVPVDAVTDLPTHAPTTTSEPQPVETSIQVSLEAGTNVLDDDGASFEALFGSDAAFEEAEILINRPGQLSLLTSPFMAIAYVEPGPDRLVQVTLLGEDGRILDEKKVTAMDYLGMDNGNMITELNFEIEGLSELGRLEISVTDEFGRIRAYNSVNLVLLSLGETDRNYAPEAQERVIIQYPLDNYMVQGTSLLVSGLVRTTSEQALTLTLIDEEGNLVGEGSASVVLAEGGDYGLFIGEIAFEVETPIWVRLAVAIPGERIPGYEFIKTMEMVISP